MLRVLVSSFTYSVNMKSRTFTCTAKPPMIPIKQVFANPSAVIIQSIVSGKMQILPIRQYPTKLTSGALTFNQNNEF
jgi:hypothetical protein